ncbi:discoidin domain-containing protein, partial [Coprobacillus cateniformis]|nr:discoidin domain-containing protein [Coprobacillus cateniformis]
ITDGQGNTENITIGGLYKYIKVAMKNSHGSHYQVKEVKFHDSQLLSLNKTVEVSSTSTNDPGNVKENAVDGNTNTRWSSLRKESGFDKQEEWISVDLGRKARIDAIEVLWESACSNDFTIEVSNDNETWTTVQQNLKPDSSLNNQIVLDKSVEGRYVRIHSYASASKYGISIFELSIYGQNLSRNIALNKTADSSSDYKSDTVVAKAVDGNTQSKWSSGRKDPGYDTQEEWMSVDLGQISYIDGVKIDWESGCSENYNIEVSNDNENWTTVKERLKSNTVAASDKHYIDNVMFDETLE